MALYFFSLFVLLILAVSCVSDNALYQVTKRMDFYGPAVNRAARVEGQAEGGQFLICESTYLHTVRHFTKSKIQECY